jgi:hypothetical protein
MVISYSAVQVNRCLPGARWVLRSRPPQFANGIIGRLDRRKVMNEEARGLVLHSSMEVWNRGMV